jgi:hypothetical protein
VRAALDDLAASSTRIWSALRMVESRCAMTNVVRPGAAPQAVLDERFALAVEAGGGLVEHQDPRGSARIARAIATRCRCPPDSFTPRSPTMVSYWSRSPR